jgi:hypothetical protein
MSCPVSTILPFLNMLKSQDADAMLDLKKERKRRKEKETTASGTSL